MPHFDRELRHYSQFKRDLNKQVMPQIRARDATLLSWKRTRRPGKEHRRRCARNVVKTGRKLWRSAKTADIITDGIRRFRTLKEGENTHFNEFVTLVEDGYRDLTRLGLEAEIATSSVSIIEKALLTDIRIKWAETA